MVGLGAVLGLVFLLMALPPLISLFQYRDLNDHLHEVSRDARKLVSVLGALPMNQQINMLEGLNSGQVQLLAAERSGPGAISFGPFDLEVFTLDDQVTLIQAGEVVWSQAFEKGPIPETWRSLLPLTTEHFVTEQPASLARHLKEWSTRDLNAATWMVPLNSRQVLAVTVLQLKEEALWGPLLLLSVSMLLAWTLWVLLPALAGSVLVSSWLAGRDSKRLNTELKRISSRFQQTPDFHSSGAVAQEGVQELGHLELELNQIGQQFHETLKGLQQQMGQQQDFMHSISHDLRTPLSHILAFSEDLQYRLQESPLQRKAHIIHREALALNHMVSDVFDVLRFDQPEFRLQFRPVLLSDLLEHQVERFQPMAQSRNVHLRCVPVPHPVQVMADPERLGQVLGNLLSNALRHTPPGGTIELDLDFTPEDLQIQVRDTGTGIAPEHLPHLFQRFYRAEGPSAERHSGLGLTICRQLVEKMDGHISVRSVLGVGSTFTVHFPIKENTG
ncbi:hypothetical protein DC3_49680 [Deinococcus cellulosilyticus NBRC 106333 = KACC 11606]|uniref:histidine kinase n=2 Tax=Deinococcus cellulosilyticus TaxID=401558 RepID=A0A511N902_DEIC1|nr:hypothetical protein DC3_49680 [Deinococcus cellulosilyticus NBRC 106333 = KACC 11606]